MGMGRLLADVQAQRLRLQQQYLDAEATALSLFAVRPASLGHSHCPS